MSINPSTRSDPHQVIPWRIESRRVSCTCRFGGVKSVQRNVRTPVGKSALYRTHYTEAAALSASRREQTP